MTTALATNDQPSLREAAALALAAAGGNIQDATSVLTERALSDEAFLRTNLTGAVRVACYDAVAGLVRSERKKVWETPQPTTQQRAAQVQALASGVVRTLMDFPLPIPGGRRLGDASRAEVMQSAQFYGEQARDMSWKSRWLEHVGQSIPEGKRVSEVITNERLEELRQEVAK